MGYGHSGIGRNRDKVLSDNHKNEGTRTSYPSWIESTENKEPHLVLSKVASKKPFWYSIDLDCASWDEQHRRWNSRLRGWSIGRRARNHAEPPSAGQPVSISGKGDRFGGRTACKYRWLSQCASSNTQRRSSTFEDRGRVTHRWPRELEVDKSAWSPKYSP